MMATRMHADQIVHKTLMLGLLVVLKTLAWLGLLVVLKTLAWLGLGKEIMLAF